MKKRIIVLVAIIALVTILGTVFVACDKSKKIENWTKDDCTQKLTSKGYLFEVMDEESLKEEGMLWGFYAYKEYDDDFDFVAGYKYANESDAIRYENLLKTELEEGESCARYGSLLLYGTPKGIEDLTK